MHKGISASHLGIAFVINSNKKVKMWMTVLR